jgi:hypothetical protein
MVNSLGKYDGGWAESTSLTDETKQELEACDNESGGCLLSIVHDETNGMKSKARAILKKPTGVEAKQLLAGPPETLDANGYLKDIFFDVNSEFGYTSCVLISGVYAKRELQSVGLPTHMPLLVIRDPPGGMSYTSYENVQSTVALESHERSHFVGFEASMTLGGGVKMETETCVGLGASKCVKDMEATAGLDYTVAGGGTFMAEHGNFNLQKSGGFSTSWSYQTSDDEFAAGRDSDTFMVPNLNVKYTEIDDIIWNSTICTATKETEYRMNLESKTNKQALAFVSMYDVENHIIPKLESMVAAKQEELNDPQVSLEETLKELKAIEDGLKGWNDTVNDHEATNALESKDLPKVKNWFTGWVTENDLIDGEKDIMDGAGHWAALLPEKLFNRAEALQVSKAVSNTAGALEDTYTVEFSGGGGLMEFHLTHEHMSETTSKLGLPRENSQGFHSGETEIPMEAEFPGFYLQAGFQLTENSETEESHSKTTTKEGSTDIGFVLGDGDSDDHFVVDIYTDPKYGTFLFKTTSGLSMCVHEPGTLPGALASIQVSKRPVAPVLPDAAMVFQLQLQNRGPVGTRFELFAYHHTNTGNLALSANGGGLSSPMVYEKLDGEGVVFATLTVHRGPLLYEYPPLEIGFRLACDNTPYKSKTSAVTLFNEVVDEKQKIVFAEPCQKVFWANLEDGYQLTINADKSNGDLGKLKLTVFNPDYMMNSFQAAINGTRLETVSLKYRELGDFQWKYSLSYDESGNLEMENNQAKKIDFAHQEDAFGYARANWEYANQQQGDGTYELFVETECQTINGAPAEFNHAHDQKLVVILDRELPKLHGYPLPNSGGFLWPGDDVVFSFNEPVMCEEPYRFQLSVSVEGVEQADDKLRIFTSDDLNVVCKENQIRFTFDQTKVVLGDLLGKSMVAVLSDVYDVAGNPYQGDGNRNEIIHTFTHAMVDMTQTTVWFDVVLVGGCEASQVPADGIVRSRVAEYMGLADPGRIGVDSATCSSTSLTAKVQVYGNGNSPAVGRRLADDHVSAVSLARKLVESTKSFPIQIVRAGLILGEEDERERKSQVLLDERLDVNSSQSFVREQRRVEGIIQDGMNRIHGLQEKQAKDGAILEELKAKQDEDRDILKAALRMNQAALRMNQILTVSLVAIVGLLSFAFLLVSKNNVLGRNKNETSKVLDESLRLGFCEGGHAS